ncbi:MAG TPA: SCE4755 family polysaccharide monooxygenase-like protein [Cellvibrionaceae bacterium]
MRFFSLILLFLGVSLSNQSHAHTRWALDGLVKPRTDSTAIKTGPCGAPRTTNRVTELIAGSKVQVKVESVIYHTGVFKIYFSAANDQNFTLLADNIKDYADQRFQTYTLTLPNQPCDKCTLQLIQTMPDSGNSLYYSCADIKLTSPVVADTTPPSAVTNLRLQSDVKTISLGWQNPAQDYAQTLVVQSTAPLSEYPQAGVEYRQDSILGNGKVVLLAAQTGFQSLPLTSGLIYYYTVFAVDSSRNYSKFTQISGQLNQINQVPTVAILAEQAGQIKQKFLTTDGLITLQANVSDADASDQHRIDWAGTDYRLLDLAANDAAFTFDPSALKAGAYKVVVKATDSGTPNMQATAEVSLNIEEPAATTPTLAGAIGGLELFIFGGLILAGMRVVVLPHSYAATGKMR